MQAFYIIQNATIQQDEIEELEILTDWIAVFKDSVCVGTYPWMGYETTLPAMGYDGSALTENYLLSGDYPTFYIFDSSEDEYMSAEVTISDIYGNEYNGWGNFDFFFVEEIVGRGPDCSGVELGNAFIDDCGICICGFYSSDETPLGCLEDIPNIDLDCSGVCEPSTPIGVDQAEEGLEFGALKIIVVCVQILKIHLRIGLVSMIVMEQQMASLKMMNAGSVVIHLVLPVEVQHLILLILVLMVNIQQI